MRRASLKIVAITTLCLSWLNFTEATEGVQTITSESSVTKVPKPISRDVTAGLPTPKRPSESELREIRDLKAQEAMAKWAYWMLVASVAGSLLTILGLIFVWRTLHHTRRTADFAGDSVTDNRNAAASQLRAYVGAPGINYSYNKENKVIAVVAELKNFGQTPAYELRARTGLHYLPYPVQESDFPLLGDVELSRHTLYPGMATQMTNLLPVDAERAITIRNGTHCFFTTIIAEYRDHVGSQHLEEIRLDVTGNPNSILWDETHTGSMNFLIGKSEKIK